MRKGDEEGGENKELKRQRGRGFGIVMGREIAGKGKRVKGKKGEQGKLWEGAGEERKTKGD